MWRLFGFGFRWKVYRLRKKYDRIREKADRCENPEKRNAALAELDNIENTLIMLEEQNVSRLDRGRFITSVRMGIEKAKSILEEDYIPQQHSQRRR